MLEKLLQIALDRWRFLCKGIELEQTYVNQLSFSDTHTHTLTKHTVESL